MSQPLDGCRFRTLFAGAVLVLAAFPSCLLAQSDPFGLSGAAPTLPLSPGVPHNPTPEVLQIGETLFNQDWKTTKAHPNSDGLGPLYNARSCVQCHRQGGVGGSGDRARDVEMLSIAAPLNQTRDSQRLAHRAGQRAHKLHPSLSPFNAAVVLHNFGHTETVNVEEYAAWRRQVRRNRQLAIFKPTEADAQRGPAVYLVRRNTPALFGAGLIDSIPDMVLIETARAQAERGIVSGRVARHGSGGIGRFGWRGQMTTLREFVVSACANELGLSSPHMATPTFPLPEKTARSSPAAGAACDVVNPKGDVVDEQQQATDAKAIGVVFGFFAQQGNPKSDLTDAHCDALTEFVASFPSPKARAMTADAARGEKIFQQVGCAECHQRDLGNVQGIYSDLLLHDMGQALEDPIAADPEPVIGQQTTTSTFYGGGGVPLARSAIPTTRTTQEWRTPPLWGLVDSAPYLHDGRAPDVDHAIRLHGGEAASSAERYGDLTETDRKRLLLFLATLDGDGHTINHLPYD